MTDTDTLYVHYFDAIDTPRAQHLMRVITEALAKHRPKTLCLLLSSKGGSVDAGIALYNFLRSLPVTVVTHSTGVVKSIANVVFLAGERRSASPHGSFLFHGVMASFPKGHMATLTHLQERLSTLIQDENTLVGIVTAHTSLTESEARAFLHQGEAKDAAFALAKGIVHEVAELRIPAGAPVITGHLPHHHVHHPAKY